MLETLLLAIAPPAGFVFVPWAMAAFGMAYFKPRMFGWYFGVSAALWLGGTIVLIDALQSAEGPGGFGILLLIGMLMVTFVPVFVIAACIAFLRHRQLKARAALESI